MIPWIRTGLLVLASASPALAQSQAFIINPEFVTEEGEVSQIDPSGTFLVGHAGSFRGELYYISNLQSDDGFYIEPNLVALWQLANSDLQPVGTQPWMGDDENQAVLASLSFDPVTGLGSVQLDLPVARIIGSSTYAPLPKDGVTVAVVLGAPGELGLNADGIPQNFGYYSLLTFDTDYPDLLCQVEENHVAAGDVTLVQLVFDGSTAVDRIVTVQPIGTAMLRFSGSSASSWNFTIPAFTRTLSVQLDALREGTYFIRATLDDGTSADSQTAYIDPAAEVAVEDATFGFLEDDLGSETVERHKQCVPPVGSNDGSDRIYNCTGWFVELITPNPPNPNCVGNPYLGFYRPAYCKPPGEECRIGGETSIQGQKFEYQVTEDRSAGKVTVGMKVQVNGEANFFLIKKGVQVEGSISVESPITRRCCKATAVPGETGTMKVPGCL